MSVNPEPVIPLSSELTDGSDGGERLTGAESLFGLCTPLRLVLAHIPISRSIVGCLPSLNDFTKQAVWFLGP